MPGLMDRARWSRLSQRFVNALNKLKGPPPTVFHVTHYKAGSQWIRYILYLLAPDRLVEPAVDRSQFLRDPIRPGMIYPTVYVTREEYKGVALPPGSRRFVVVRDLRDTLVSSYFSLKVSHQVCSAEMEESRRELSALPLEEGLLYALDRELPKSAAIQHSWAEAGEPLLRYEDLLNNDVALMDRVLRRKCRWPVSSCDLRQVVLGSRFELMTRGRPRGKEDVTAHQRKGVAGDWRNHFSPRVKDAFKQRYGRLLIATGYETNLDW